MYYCLFKETKNIENNIKCNVIPERSAIAQFRFGIVPMNIENQALDKRLLYSMWI